MKKFNSILAIAAVALTSVFGFTSCDKADDDVFTQPTRPDVTNTSGSSDVMTNYKYYGYQVYVNDEALQYGDYVITANYDGKSVEYYVSEGQSMTVTIDQLKNTLDGCTLKKDLYPGKILTIPTFESKTGSVSFSCEFKPNKSAIENAEADSKIDFVVRSSYFATNISNYSIDIFNTSNISITKGIKSDSNGTYGGGVKTARIAEYLQSQTVFFEYSL